MVLYHGSNLAVAEPKLVAQNRFLDFGFGFYTTTNRMQAIGFANKVTKRRKTGIPTVSVGSDIGESACAFALYKIFAGRGTGMSTEKFEALLILIVPQVVALIVQNTDLNELAASQAFYESEVYALLEQEYTKLWQLSPQTLFHMYEEETATGKITFPEG